MIVKFLPDFFPDAYHVRSFVTALQYFHLEILVKLSLFTLISSQLILFEQANIVVLSFALNGSFLSTAEKVIVIVLFVYLLIVVFIGTMAVSLLQKIAVQTVRFYCIVS